MAFRFIVVRSSCAWLVKDNGRTRSDPKQADFGQYVVNEISTRVR